MSGNVAIDVAKGVDLHVDVETASGSVHSDIPLDNLPPARGAARDPGGPECAERVGQYRLGRALEQVTLTSMTSL